MDTFARAHDIVKYPPGSNPIDLFLDADIQTRSEVLLNHPDVTGFVYIHDDEITKAFFPTKVIDFKAKELAKRKTIAAVTGSPTEYSPFSVPENVLLSDNLHISDSKKFSSSVPRLNIGSWLKDNQSKLSIGIPEEFTEKKVKNVQVISFPVILPMVKGLDFDEGNLDDEDICNKFLNLHELYSDWVFLQGNKYIVNSEFRDLSCPLPEGVCDVVSFEADLNIKVLLKSKNSSNSPYTILKALVDDYIQKHSPDMEKPASIPPVIDINADLTVASSANTKIVEKNEKLIAFLSILFSLPSYDRSGNITGLVPGDITDEASELLLSSTSTSEQARSFGDGIEALADDISKEKNYLSRAAEFPYLSQTLITYALQAHYHSGSIDKNMESLKKSFNVLTLLAPPHNESNEYSGYINSSRDVEVDRLLDQPAEKRSSIRKEIFLKGRQESLEDVITFIANITVFARFWIKMNDDTQPLMIQLLTEIADFLSSAEYKVFHDKFKKCKVYMPHTLISYIFNIVSIFIKMAKTPQVTRKFKITNTVDHKEIKMAIMMQSTLMDQLQLCAVTSSTQNIFAQAPVSFKIFCPSLYKAPELQTCLLPKRPYSLLNQEHINERKKPKQEPKGAIINTTGRKIFFPRGLEQKYCSDFLDSSSVCTHGNSCKFVHALYPKGFTTNDLSIIDKFIADNPGLSFNPTVKRVS